MIDRDRTVLPDPDSPTTPRVLPWSSTKLTPSTARTFPRGVRNTVFRSVTSSRWSGAVSGAVAMTRRAIRASTPARCSASGAGRR